jgi:hypothetical protein
MTKHKTIAAVITKKIRSAVTHRIIQKIGSFSLTILVVVIACELITKNNLALGVYMLLGQAMQKLELVKAEDDEATETVVHITAHHGEHH